MSFGIKMMLPTQKRANFKKKSTQNNHPLSLSNEPERAASITRAINSEIIDEPTLRATLG